MKYIHRFLFALCILISTKGIAQVYNAPKLTCVHNLNTSIELTWKLPTVTCGTFNAYYVYVSNSKNGPFTLLDSVKIQSQTTYTHVGVNTSQNWFYYLTSSFNCPASFFSASSDTFQNSRIQTPELLSASVINGKTVLTWRKNTVPQTWGYPIAIPGVGYADTVVGINDTTFTDTSAAFDPNTKSVAYRVGAMDECSGQNGNSGLSDIHKTMFLTQTPNVCQGTIKLEWTKYVGWNGAKEYQILVSKNGSAETKITTNDSATNSFIYNDYIVGDSLCIRILALHPSYTGVSAYSNQLCFRAQKIQQPRFLSIYRVSVISPTKVQLEWLVDSIANVKTFVVERSTDTADMEEVLRFAPNAPLKDIQKIIDTTITNTSERVFYRIVALDSCGGKTYSKPVPILFLIGEQVLLFQNQLDWFYQNIDSTTVSTTNLNRTLLSTSTIFNPTISITQYVDALETQPKQTGKACYVLDQKYTYQAFGKKITTSTLSNVVCIDLHPVIYIPNAFKPEGVNKVFKPVVSYGNRDTYRMQIFNRWGQVLFETTDVNQGWDGTYKGTLLPQDGYMYVINIDDTGGVPILKKGVVLLLR